jgi:hypothetical protein
VSGLRRSSDLDVQVTIRAYLSDGTTADYECKVKSLTFLCRTFETEVIFGILKHYRVSYNGAYRTPTYFGLKEPYAFWK